MMEKGKKDHLLETSTSLVSMLCFDVFRSIAA